MDAKTSDPILTPWKITYDAKHSLGRYYGRVAFVEAASRDEAVERGLTAARAEFPGHTITLIDLGESTTGAAQLFQQKRAEADAWKRRVSSSPLLCPTCHGTGRA